MKNNIGNVCLCFIKAALALLNLYSTYLNRFSIKSNTPFGPYLRLKVFNIVKLRPAELAISVAGTLKEVNSKKLR